MSIHDEDEEPLNPAQERLRRKLVRLLMVSGGIMMLGLIAVFAAIVYKVSEGSRTASAPASSLVGDFSADAPIDGRIAVPAGYRLVGTSLDGARALLTLESADGASLILLVDLRTGAELARHRLTEE